MYLHRARRAGLDTKAAGDAFIVVEDDSPRVFLQVESPRGTDGNAGAAAGALFLVARHVLAERLHFYPGFHQELNAFVVFVAVPLELQYQQPFLLRCNGSLEI